MLLNKFFFFFPQHYKNIYFFFSAFEISSPSFFSYHMKVNCFDYLGLSKNVRLFS